MIASLAERLRWARESGRPLVFGHRGMAGNAPENSLEGFERARLAGIEAVELDVQLSADDCVVVYHDRTLRRLHGRAGLVSGFRARDLSDIGAIPSLDDALESLGRTMYVDIELKLYGRSSMRTVHKLCHAVSEAVRRHDAANRVLLSSFSSKMVRHLQDTSGQIPCARIGRRPRGLQWQPNEPQPAIDKPQAHTVARRRRQLPATIHTIVWTVNEYRLVDKLCRNGVCGIVTDYPEEMRTWIEAVTED